MATYAGRVHCDLQEQDAVIKGLKAKCDKLIVYRHDTTRPHIHFLMTEVKCTYDTLVNVVKRAIPGATRDKYSFKANANDDFISYMSKGKLDPVFNEGFGSELIADKKSKGYDKDDIPSANHKPVEATLQPSRKTSSVTQHMLVVDIATRMVVRADIGPDDEPPYDFNDLYECTTEVLKENKKGGDIFYVMKTMESVLMMQYPNTHKHFLKNAWNSRHKIG